MEGNSLKWSKAELALLANRIRANHESARDAHRKRIERGRECLRQWHNRVEAPAAGAEQDSNFQVPFTQWVTFSKWSKALQAALGDDSEVVAQGNGPVDADVSSRVGRFMTAAVFRMMPNAFLGFAEWIWAAVFYGRAFVYRPWKVERDSEGKIVYQGPEMVPIPPEDLVVPAQENARTIQEMSWVHRQYWLDPNDFVDGTMEGGPFNLPGVADEAERSELIRKILKGAMQDGERDLYQEESAEIKDEQALGEGVERSYFDDQGLQRIRGWECFEWWRPLLNPGEEAGEFELEKRAGKRIRLAVHYCPATREIIGVRPLSEIYPDLRSPIPISECAVSCDGRYWPMGAGHQSFDIQEELSRLHNQMTDAVDMGSFGHLLYSAGSGLDPDKARQLVLGSRKATQVADVSKVQYLQARPDLNGGVLLQQAAQAYGEKSLNVSDQTLGRAIDRPNAPRTAAGQAMLMEAADVRGWIDLGFLRFWIGLFLRDVWELYCSMADGEVFFRVTEEEAGGLFQVVRGGANMDFSAQEFGGRYDFSVKLATSTVSKEAKKQEALELYQIDIQNPLIVSNPRALYMATARVHKALGDENFSRLVPEPPDIDMPLSAKTEHAKMMQGEAVHVNPGDNDQLHLVEHQNALERHLANPNRDLDYISRMMKHIQEQQAQLQQKQAMQALAGLLVRTMGQQQQNAAMGQIGTPPAGGGEFLQGGDQDGVTEAEEEPGVGAGAAGGFPGVLLGGSGYGAGV